MENKLKTSKVKKTKTTRDIKLSHSCDTFMTPVDRYSILA